VSLTTQAEVSIRFQHIVQPFVCLACTMDPPRPPKRSRADTELPTPSDVQHAASLLSTLSLASDLIDKTQLNNPAIRASQGGWNASQGTNYRPCRYKYPTATTIPPSNPESQEFQHALAELKDAGQSYTTSLSPHTQLMESDLPRAPRGNGTGKQGWTRKAENSYLLDGHTDQRPTTAGASCSSNNNPCKPCYHTIQHPINDYYIMSIVKIQGALAPLEEIAQHSRYNLVNAYSFWISVGRKCMIKIAALEANNKIKSVCGVIFHYNSSNVIVRLVLEIGWPRQVSHS